MICPFLCKGMGTKLQYVVNPIVKTPSNNNFFMSRLDGWDYFRNKGAKEDSKGTVLINFQESMDRISEQQSIESIRKTMLMHEEIFKKQVQELHRLYSVQKMMMDEIKKQSKQNSDRVPMNGSNNHYNIFNRCQPTTSEHKIQVLDNNISRSSWPERSAASASCSGFDLERPAIEEDIPTRIAAIEEMRNSQVPENEFEESDVELTLSIGGSIGKLRSKNPELIRNESIKSERAEECSGSNSTPTGSSNATTNDQRNKRELWIFQGLSLNRT